MADLQNIRKSDCRGTALKMLACTVAAAAFVALLLPQPVRSQGAPKVLAEPQLRELLVWNSPWEGRATPPQLYSFRTVFRVRSGEIVADTVSYATNQRSSSVVSVQDGRLTWQDSNGADVNVAVAESGDLVGTATSNSANLQILFKPRP